MTYDSDTGAIFSICEDTTGICRKRQIYWEIEPVFDYSQLYQRLSCSQLLRYSF
ncbi:MAG: hypothetical protein R3C26_05770 [Calditrichia bacterium]